MILGLLYTCIEITLICKKELQKMLDASILFGHMTKCLLICFTQSENSIWSCDIPIHVINSFGAISGGGFLFELKISFSFCINYEWYRKVFMYCRMIECKYLHFNRILGHLGEHISLM